MFRYMDAEAMTPILRSLVTESSLPLQEVETDFAVDSTGFSTNTTTTWFMRKYGDYKSVGNWLKAHVACGVKTNIVTAIEIGGSASNDSPYLPKLVQDAARNFRLGDVSADKGYVSIANTDAIAAAGGTPFISFKTNATANTYQSKGTMYEKMFHYFSFNRDEFLNHYHQRSNVETTFSMIKRKFGAQIRSKSDVGQVNELLAKVVAHNICVLNQEIHELGLEPVFWC